jgi:hypothetical protein
MLVNHHSIARDGRIYMGLLKQAVLDAEGTLRLGWWKGNDQRAERWTDIGIPVGDTSGAPVLMLAKSFDMSHGLILECRLRLPPCRARGG